MIQEMEDHVANMLLYNLWNHYSNWRDIKRQNELSLRIFEQSNLSFDILDGYHINILRPDELMIRRNDCLHSCYPGKMDVYNQLLVHFLQMRGGLVVKEVPSWTNQTLQFR